MSDLKWYLPGSNQRSKQSKIQGNTKEQKGKTNRAREKETGITEADDKGNIKRNNKLNGKENNKLNGKRNEEISWKRSEKIKESGQDFDRGGKSTAGNDVTGIYNLNRYRAAVAMFLALLMFFSMAVPHAEANTDFVGRVNYVDSNRSHSLKVAKEDVSDEGQQLFRSTTFLTQLLTVRNAGWYMSVLSDAGFQQWMWQNLNLLVIAGEVEPLTVDDDQATRRRSKRSSDSSNSPDLDRGEDPPVKAPEKEPGTIPDAEPPAEPPADAEPPAEPPDEPSEPAPTFYTFELTIEGQGTVTNNVYIEVTGGLKEVESGAEVILLAVPDEGYDFAHWILTDEPGYPQSTELEYTIENLQENVHITAHFIQAEVIVTPTYSVVLEHTAGGSVAFHPSHSTAEQEAVFEEGDMVTVMAIPKELYRFSRWEVDGLDITTIEASEYTFVMPPNDVVVKACYEFVHPFEGGTGQEGDPYQIKSAVQMVQLLGYKPMLSGGYAAYGMETNLLEAHYELMNNIDLSDIDWSPIGGSGANASGDDVFTGTFDGNKKTIKNLTIDQPDRSYLAMIHTIGSGAVVKDLTLMDPLVTAKSHATVLAVNNNGTVERVMVTDAIVKTESHASGLIVYNNGMMERCRVESSTETGLPLKGNLPKPANPIVIAGNDAIQDVYGSGLAVSNGINGTIKKSSVEATILIRGKGQKKVVGLLAAENRGIIDECYTIGIIDREATGGSNELIYQGGLVGINRNTKDDGNSFVRNSYTIVSQMSSGTSRGGVVGFQTNDVNPDTSAAIQYVYAVPYFQRLEDGQIGGVIGGSVNRTLMSAYFDKTIFTKTVTGKGMGKTTNEMINKATYDSWNFETIWAIDKAFNGGYPYLQWQRSE